MSNRLGPEVRGVTTRPGAITPGSSDTWFQDCVGSDPSTGTAFEANWFNRVLANFRSLFTQVGQVAVAALGDDNMIRDGVALQSQAGQMSFALDTGALNAYVITLAPAPIIALARGAMIRFAALSTNTTATPTISVNGVVKTIVAWNGLGLQPGDIVAAGITTLLLDGSGNWRLAGVSSNVAGFSTGFQAYTSGSGNFIVPAGIYKLFVELWGAGGGGGGAVATGCAGGGGGGGYCSGYFNVVPGASLPYSVGAGGPRGLAGVLGSSNGTGGTAGGSTSMLGMTGGGGLGGAGVISSGDADAWGAPGGSASGGQVNWPGSISSTAILSLSGSPPFSYWRAYGGSGGSSPRGGNGGASYLADGTPGQVPGGGAGGGGSYSGTGGVGNGGNGAGGAIFIRW